MLIRRKGFLANFWCKLKLGVPSVIWGFAKKLKINFNGSVTTLNYVQSHDHHQIGDQEQGSCGSLWASLQRQDVQGEADQQVNIV